MMKVVILLFEKPPNKDEKQIAKYTLKLNFFGYT